MAVHEASPPLRTLAANADKYGADALVLSQVQGAAWLSDGRIVVANGGTRELRYDGSVGTFSRSVDREGEGPSEFRSLDFLGRHRGDTIVAYDARLRRLSLFDEAGEFVASPGA